MTKAYELSRLSDTLSGRNAIINGNFDLWQRGTTASVQGYLADQWKLYLQNSTATQTQQEFSLGQTDVPGNPQYFHRTAFTSADNGGAHYVVLQQPIEDVRTFADETVTLSFWAKADASRTIVSELVRGGLTVPDYSIGNATFDLTTSWQYFTHTFTVPSLAGKVLDTGTIDRITIGWWYDVGPNYQTRVSSLLGAQSGTVDIAQVQFEAGDVATPFEKKTYAQELAACLRYYYHTEGKTRYMNTLNKSSNYRRLDVEWPVLMAKDPIVTFDSAVSGSGVATSGPDVLFSSPHNCHLRCDVNLDSSYVSVYSITARAEIE